MRTLKLPRAYPRMENATLMRWLVPEGSAFEKAQKLAELETEMGPLELTADAPGVLTRVLAAPRTTLLVDAPLAEVDDSGAGTPTLSSPSEEPSAMSGSPSAPGGNVIPILMPQAGQSMEEGTIVAWHVQPGDRIKKGQIIFEVETDKATVEVEATDDGRLARIVLDAGGTLPVLQPVAYLADQDSDVDALLGAASAGAATVPAPRTDGSAASPPSATTSATPAAGTVPPAKTGERPAASPAARKAAAEQGIDLGSLPPGSGPRGRILSTDVPAVAPAGAPGAVATAATPASPAGTATTPPASSEVVRRPLTGMRKAIALNLSLSKQTIPHFYMKMTCDASPLAQFAAREKAKYPCSINDVITLACGKIIATMPAFRSRIEGNEIVELPQTNIGIAVGLEEGLVVPVITAIDTRTLQDLAQESRRIIGAARNGKISGIGQGVFTISNMGMFGISEFSAIINPPESAILAIGAVREEVIVSGGTMRPGKVMTVTLSVDHRVVDGVGAAKFLNRLKEILEYPEQLL